MSLDPIVLATLTAGATTLSQEVAKGLASAAGKDAWERLKSLFGWASDPLPAEVPERVAKALVDDPVRAREVLALLQASGDALVGGIVLRVDIGKIVNIRDLHAHTVNF